MGHEARHIDVIRQVRRQFAAAPALGQHGPNAAHAQGFQHDLQRFAHIAADHGAKAHINGLSALGKELLQPRLRGVFLRIVRQPVAGHMDVRAPIRRPGHHQRTQRIQHGNGMAVQFIGSLVFQLTWRQAVLLAPIVQIVLFHRADEKIAQMIAGRVPRLAHTLAGSRSDGCVGVIVHHEILGLDKRQVAQFRHGADHLPEERADDAVALGGGVLQILHEGIHHILQGVAHLIEIRHTVHAGLHDIAHKFPHIAGQAVEAQPFAGNRLFKIGKSGNRHLMAPALQFASQHDIGTHVAGGTDTNHRNTHFSARLALFEIPSGFISVVQEGCFCPGQNTPVKTSERDVVSIAHPGPNCNV